MVRGLLVAAFAALLVAPAAFAGGPSLKVGAVEDAAKWSAPAAKMDLARLAGFDTVRMTMQWSAGQTAPDPGELANTQSAAQAALAAGIEPVISIYNRGSSSTPAEDASRAQFVQFATAVVRALPTVQKFIVGNEPNSNYYWLPQFNGDGSDAAAPAYVALLAASYDAIKQVRPDALVIGGALDPRGADNPTGTKPTHSPTSFIADLGAAYRASARTTPIMDVFDQHVYADNSSLPPSMEHPNTSTIAEADYGKLVTLLGQAFDGTAQAGSTLPILYGEFGVETVIPAGKAALYSGTEPTTTKAVDEATQAKYYAEAFKLAYCQPNVIGILLFHVTDESALAAWQSGPYYADDSAKSSLATIRDAARASRAGTLASCPDAVAPTVSLAASGNAAVSLSATASDDVGVGKVEFLANGAVVGTKYAPPYTMTWAPKTSGTYTFTARAQDAVRNVGTSAAVDLTVDGTAPETTIDGLANDTFSFSASEPGTFACSIDNGAWSACTSPARYPGLATGSHTFQVRATDLAGNVDASPAAMTWTVVDTTPPETTLSVANGTATFSASETATFECSLDGGAWAACTSPSALPKLADGTHTFQVRATDGSGNVDPTPASSTWTQTSTIAAKVSSIAYSKSGSTLTITVTTNAPGASVALRITRNGSLYASGTVAAGSNGVAVARVSVSKGCYATTITSLTKTGYAWDGVTPSNGKCF